jgi:hypothetical protein
MKFVKNLLIAGFFVSSAAICAEKPSTILDCKFTDVPTSVYYLYNGETHPVYKDMVLVFPVNNLNTEGDAYTYVVSGRIVKDYGKITISRIDGKFIYNSIMGSASGICTAEKVKF